MRWGIGRSWVAYIKTLRTLGVAAGDCACEDLVNTLRNGIGPPAADLGIDGDFYIDDVAHTMYGPKGGIGGSLPGQWVFSGSPISLVGTGGGFTPPTGTGFAHTTSGSLDGASKKVDLSTTADVTNTLGIGNGGTGLATPGTSGNVLTSTGTGWASSAPAGQAVGAAGQIQASNGTNGFNAPGPYVGATWLSIPAGEPDFDGFRAPNNTVFACRNFAGTADIVCCYVDSANMVRVGSSFDTTQAGILFGTRAGAGNTFAFNFGSGLGASLSETEFLMTVPRHGYGAPYASEGQAPFAITTTAHTITATEYTYRVIKFTGTFGGTSTVSGFPLPSNNGKSYGKTIRNTSTTALTLSAGSGTTYAVAAGATAEITVTPDGIVGVTTGGGSSSVGAAGQIQATDGTNFTAPGPYVGASYVSIISGTPTSNGYRMGNGHILAGRNVAGSADLHICYVDSSNNIILGDNQAGQGPTYVMAPSQIYLSIGGALSFGITSTAITTLVAKVTQTAVSATDIVTDTAQVNTTNATGTTIYTVPIANNAVTAIDIRITACQSTSASADVWRGSATFKNAAGTVATVEGANITHGGSTSWGGVGFSISGTNVLISVTGAASTTIEWGLSVNYQVTRQS